MPVRFAYPEEPDWLVDWILCDLAVRQRSHRRKPMAGMWINRQFGKLRKGERNYLRGADLAERRYVALAVLLMRGGSMSEALYEVSRRLGKTTQKELDVIRTSFYGFQGPLKSTLLEHWLGSFRNWTDWAIFADTGAVSSVAEMYRKKGHQDYADRFLKLVQAVQDKAFKEQKRSLYRDQNWYIEAEREYSKRLALTENELGPNHSMVGLHAFNLAHLYHEQARYREALRWYWHAWAIYLGDPIMAPGFRAVLLQAIATDVGNCKRGKPAGRVSPYSGPWTAFGLLPAPGISQQELEEVVRTKPSGT